MHIIEESFGVNCNLYSDVLECKQTADNASLRKAYYRTALKYHPDKNPNQPKIAAQKFHAITAAYQILCNTELREEYDKTGIIPNSNDGDDDDDDEFMNHSDKVNPWKEYFDRIFGKVRVDDIEAFAMKYKCSDEERRDVLKQYVQQKGDLNKMMNHVMLSESYDAQRWVEDYIQPAIDDGTVPSTYTSIMNKTLQQLNKKAEKEYNQAKKTKNNKNEDLEDEDEEDDDFEDDDDDEDMEHDEDETEEEELEDEEMPSPAPKQGKAKQKPVTNKSPKKAQVTKGKVKAKATTTTTKIVTKNKSSKKDDMSDLIARIQNKNSGSSNNANTWSTFGARYGVSISNENDDPIQDDEVFQSVQSKLKNNQSKTKSKPSKKNKK